MILPNEKTYRGKFISDSKRCKTGRITVPAKLARSDIFPLRVGSTVRIIPRNGYLIIEPLGDTDLEAHSNIPKLPFA